jgi:hypothetical protein
LSGLLGGLTENRAETDPTSTDDRLRGRTYAIPFENVWQAATRLASGEIKGWSLWVADDQEGHIEASIRPFLFLAAVDVRIRVGLDQNAQTRVDLTSKSRTERGDLGRSRRSIGRFIGRLDTLLEAGAGQILDATRTAVWQDPG